MLDTSHKGATTALVTLFFAIGSPYAVGCLRDACRQAHHLRGIDTIPEEAGARRSTCALDRIHAHDKVWPILCRHHLVQLVSREASQFGYWGPGSCKSIAKHKRN